MLKLPIFILMWIVMICIKIPTAFFGFFVVPFLYQYRDTDYKDLQWWTRPWSNPVNWTGQPGNYKSSLPLWWVEDSDVYEYYKGLGTGFWSFYRYYARRNSANGLRSFKWLALNIDPSKVKYKTNFKMKRYEPNEVRKLALTTAWHFTWQGFKSGFKIIHIWPDKKKDTHYWFFGSRVIRKGPRHLVIKLWWRIEPEDASGGDKYFDIEMKSAGFALKVLLYRWG